MTPKITNMLINGILCNLFLKRNNVTRETIVIPKVITLN